MKEIRQQLKKLGYKIKVKTLSFGKTFSFYDMEGNRLPSIFTTETLEQWQPLLDWKEANKAVLLKLKRS